MPIQLYGLAMSTCAQRVLTTLHEKGLKYELINVDFANGEHKVEEVLKKHFYIRRELYVERKVSRRKTTIWCHPCAHRRRWFQNLRLV